MTGPIWILGKGGMLGSRMDTVLRQREMFVWDPPIFAISWTDPARLCDQIGQACTAFAMAAREPKAWTVVWAAGRGTVGTDEDALRGETNTLAFILDLLGGTSALMAPGVSGRIFFASSAGAIYGASGATLTEESPTVPVSAYGKAKLEQEELLHTWAAAHPNVSVMVGRISNLYGEGQNLGKPQGIISHLCQRVLEQRPIQIYVPLDTIRDYLYVGDCAEMIAECLPRITDPWTVKLFASESVTTIAEILSIVRRIAKRAPRIVTVPHPSASQHVRAIRFHSVVQPDVRRFVRTSLPDGIHRVYAHQLAALQAGTSA